MLSGSHQRGCAKAVPVSHVGPTTVWALKHACVTWGSKPGCNLVNMDALLFLLGLLNKEEDTTAQTHTALFLTYSCLL